MIILQATIPISYFILRLIPNFFPVSSMKFPLRLVSHRENKLLDFFGRHNGVFTCVCIFGMFSRLLSSFLIGNFWYVLLVFSKTECMYRVSQNVSWEASQNMFFFLAHLPGKLARRAGELVLGVDLEEPVQGEGGAASSTRLPAERM